MTRLQLFKETKGSFSIDGSSSCNDPTKELTTEAPGCDFANIFAIRKSRKKFN